MSTPSFSGPGFYAARLTRPGAVLAPMAGYSDAPMRQLASEQGALWTVSEMLSARGLVLGQDQTTAELGRPYPGEQGRVVQLFGAEPELLAAAAQVAEATLNPAALDLNLGCPVPKVRGKGGSCLLQTPEVAYALLHAMRQATRLDVSAKLRLGWDHDHAQALAHGLEAAGASLITVHGRTAAQRYTGEADWEAIARVAQAVNIPVVGSGDVRSVAGLRARQGCGVAAVMIGRGAVGNPWLFAQASGAGEAEPGLPERAALARRHAELNAQWYGEGRGLRQLRKVLPQYFPAGTLPPAALAALYAELVRAESLAGLDRSLDLHLGAALPERAGLSGLPSELTPGLPSGPPLHLGGTGSAEAV